MDHEPTRGATEQAGWHSVRWVATAVRLLAYLLPVVVSWGVVHLVAGVFWLPGGLFGLMIWVAQALVVAVSVSLLVERQSNRLLPLSYLFNLALVFPDRVPSRYGVALRSGFKPDTAASSKRLTDASDVGEAAICALELVTALSRHDRVTRGHTERVRAYSELIAIELGLSAKDRERLVWGAMLHDIGKMAVPEEILNKREALTDIEWEALRSHPAAARDLLGGLDDWLGPWLLAASEHHERWDGTGYPDGLVAEEISLAGRIVAVADAYDVITSVRAYKAPMSSEAARAELVRCSGTQFDPDVVRAFLAVGIGERKNAGFLGWLLELPTVSRLGMSLSSVGSTALTAGTVAVVAVSGALSPVAETTDGLAFIDEQEEAVTATTPGDPTTGSTVSPSVSTPDSATTVSTLQAGATTTDGVGATTSATTELGSTGSSTTTSRTGTTARATTSPRATSTTTTATGPTTTTTATGPTTTTTTTSTTTTTAVGPLTLYLGNPGSGNTSSSPSLAMSPTSPSGSVLPNYDTDRDSEAGLGLAKDGTGLGTSDPTKYQEWTWTLPAGQTMSGLMEFWIWVGAKDGNGGETIGIAARVQFCDPGCVTVGSDTWSGGSSPGGPGVVQMNFGSVSQTLSAGVVVKIKVVAPDSLATTNIVLGYDLFTQPARLQIS